MSPEINPQEPAASAPGNGNRMRDADGNGESAADALRKAFARLADLRAYAGYFVAAKLDRLKLTIRQYVILAILGVLGLVAGAAALVTAIVLILNGVAGAIAALFEHTYWLGDVICGVLVLASMVLVVWLAVARLTKTSRESTVNKYESDQRKQHVNLSGNIAQDQSSAADGIH